MKSIRYITILVLLIIVSSCNFQYNIKSIDGNGNVLREEFEILEKIDIIKASAGLDVEIIYGPRQHVVIEADENLHEYISTDLKNGILDVTTSRNIRTAKSKKVTVVYVDIEGIHASSGAQVYAPTELVSNSLDLKTSSGAKLNANVISRELTAQSSSGSSMTLKGQALNFNSKASSGSELDARELKGIYCTARASSGANIFLNIEKSLDARASSSGSIQYSGDPEVVNQNTSSSGRVIKM